MNSQGFSREQKQSQALLFGPQLRHSLKILQVPALELRNVILEELQSNPVLEELPMETESVEELTRSPEDSESRAEDRHNPQEMNFKEEYDVLQKLDADWKEHFFQIETTNPFTTDDAIRRHHFLNSFVSKKSLQEHIMEQAQMTECSDEELETIEHLAGSLDDRGYLTAEVKEVAEFAEKRFETVRSALDLLKSLDPPGIGCRDVPESLLVQLETLGKEKSLAARIIRDEYKLLLRRRIPDITKKLGVTSDDVQDAIEEIGRLDPAPGRSFIEDSNFAINPDITIKKQGDNWKVTLNSTYIPRLRLSQYYKNLVAEDKLGSKEKAYIRDKIRSGNFIISSIDQRQQTLKRIAEAILETQMDFFEEGVSKLHPLTMNQIGKKLELHGTTISRAIANKYVETPYGVFELKYFFASGYESEDGESISSRSIKESISQIVESEFPKKPFSDQKIVEILKGKNIKIARRTVAKYREELGILSTSLRRRY